MAKTTHNSRFFVFAPPLLGVRKSKRKRIQIPFKGAASWQCSVYYYWWEYLRRHEGYKATCEAGGQGEYTALYADFGDVFASDFWTWWKTHGILFLEPLARELEVVKDGEVVVSDDNTLVIRVPLENKLSLNVQKFKTMLSAKQSRVKYARIDSQARYQVPITPRLSTLHRQLMLWDAHKANPDMPLADLLEFTGMPYNRDVHGETLGALEARELPTAAFKRELRKRMRHLVQRDLRIAEQYIENVAKGEFPKRNKR